MNCNFNTSIYLEHSYFEFRNNQHNYYIEFKKKFCDIGLQLATSAQRDTFAENPVSIEIPKEYHQYSQLKSTPITGISQEYLLFRFEKSSIAAKD